ncbi:hypothetical protein I302_100962 [Kwoniella bestiolae CBS 10118]|uniref:Uncharacterized protein n=1 Tax=Kwoniella bestiolae CBS 10118 TaxID=1296100 RepID=A0A1B9G6M2_9TREE|nr:hypothetical protein I302_04339 [Kwoniella bestiolae CBS 10118]OCF26653.1 hypothetical protein I302_04339 [Kwoniella bestiolae CBS 10118]
MTDTDEDGWNRRPVLWYIYRDSGVDLKFDKKGQPLNPLPDKDVLYNLTCYHAVHKSAPNGAHFSQKLNLSAQTIIRPYGNDIWESLRGKANFYCPSGGCVHSDCQGQYIPNWTQELYDEQHGNTTTSRDPINQIAGTNSTSSSSAAATQSA